MDTLEKERDASPLSNITSPNQEAETKTGSHFR